MTRERAVEPAPPAAVVPLQITGLTISYPAEHGRANVIEDVTFELRSGETLGLVGESGSGKSMTALALLRLHEAAGGQTEAGSIRLFGRELLALDEGAMANVRGRQIAMIFQDATASLDPARTIGQQLCAVIRRHLGVGSKAARARAADLLGEVGIPEPGRRLDQYPHQFSGGMCQRVMIAMALSCEPQVLLADEPTTALDVTTQAQIIDLLHDLAARYGMSTLFTTHDLSLVSEICDRVAVMYAGQIVEMGTIDEVFDEPTHPYTQALLDCVAGPETGATFRAIAGQAPSPVSWPAGCRFRPRCRHATDACREDVTMVELSPGRHSRCRFAGELALPGVPE